MKAAVDANGDIFPSSESETKSSILDLVGFGATFEDNRSALQAIRHFYNPVDGSKLLFGIGATSPDWALENMGFKDGQAYTFRLMRRSAEAPPL